MQPGELLPNPNDGSDTTVVNARYRTGYAGLQHGLRIVGGAAGGGGAAVAGEHRHPGDAG